MEQHDHPFTALQGFLLSYSTVIAGYTLQDFSQILQIVVLIIGAVSGLIGIYNGLNRKK